MKQVFKIRIAKILLVSLLLTQSDILQTPGAAMLSIPVKGQILEERDVDKASVELNDIEEKDNSSQQELNLIKIATPSNAQPPKGDTFEEDKLTQEGLGGNRPEIGDMEIATPLNARKLMSNAEVWDGVSEQEVFPVNDIYNIQYPSELAWVMSVTNDGTESFDGKIISIINDLDMGGYEWGGIGTLNNPFKGSFNGNGHIISGIKQENQTSSMGLFGAIEVQNNISIRDLNIDNAEFSGNAGFAGILSGYIKLKGGTKLTILNIETSGTLDVSGCSFGGGLVGNIYSPNSSTLKIENVKTSGEMTIIYSALNNSVSNTGCIIGCYDNQKGNINLKNSGSSMNIHATAQNSAKMYVGGVWGSGNGDLIEFSKVYTTGTLYGEAYDTCIGGGMIGYCETDTLKITNCYTANDIQMNGINGWAGGLLGFLRCKVTYGDSSLINCHISGHLGARQYAAFIVQNDSGTETVSVESCYYNKNNISLKNSEDKITHLGFFKTDRLSCPRGYGITDSEMKEEMTFSDWDFDNVWVMQENGYPELQENISLKEGLTAIIDSDKITYSQVEEMYNTKEVNLSYAYWIDEGSILEDEISDILLARVKIVLPDGLSFSKDELITEMYIEDETAPSGYVYLALDEAKTGKITVFIDDKLECKEIFRFRISISAIGFESYDAYKNVNVQIIEDGMNDNIIEDNIVEIVGKYTTGEMLEAWKQIEAEGGSTESKGRKLTKLFVKNGIPDPLYGMAYLKDTHNERIAYEALISNEMYLAYQYKYYLNNTVKGMGTRVSLVASALVFNNEADEWASIDTLQLETPGVKRYKEMLQNFIYKSSSQTEILNRFKKILSFTKTIDGDINLTELAELEAIINKGTIDEEYFNNRLKSLLPKLFERIKDSSFDKKTGRVSCKLKDSNFSNVLKYSSDTITLLKISCDEFYSYVDLSSKISTYKQYEDFLQEIVNAKALPLEMRLAANSLLIELDNGYLQPLIKALEDIGNWATGKLDFAKLKIGLFDYDAVKLVSYAINTWADVGKLTEQSKYTEGYGFLGEYFAEKLKRDEKRFLNNKTEKNAYMFFNDYQLLYQIRLAGEKAYHDMSDMEGASFILYKEIFDKAMFQTNIDAANDNIKYLEENCKMNVSDKILQSEEVKYAKKVVIDCPVDIRISDLLGNEICYLSDGEESDIQNEYGRFTVWYDSYSKDYGKSICLFDENNVDIEIIVRDIGMMSVQVANKEGNIYKISNKSVSPGETYLVQLSEVPVCTLYDNNNTKKELSMILDDKIYIPVSDIKIIDESINCNVGDSIAPNIVVLPENASNQQLSWFSNNESVATVFNGKVTALSVGEADITIRTLDGYASKTLHIVVNTEDINNNIPDTPQEIQTAIVSVYYNAGGTITPGTLKLSYGESKTFTIVPDKDFIIAQVLVDGNDVGAVSTYEFANIKENHTITAVFKPKTEKLPYDNKIIHDNSSSDSDYTQNEITLLYPYLSHLGQFICSGTWKRNSKGWLFLLSDGSNYARNQWAYIDNQWYLFDKNAYMIVGWANVDGRWYYLNPVSDGTQGRMLTGWQLINEKWYYFNEISDGTKGAMMADTWVGDYYVDLSGAWDKNKKEIKVLLEK